MPHRRTLRGCNNSLGNVSELHLPLALQSLSRRTESHLYNHNDLAALLLYLFYRAPLRSAIASWIHAGLPRGH